MQVALFPLPPMPPGPPPMRAAWAAWAACTAATSALRPSKPGAGEPGFLLETLPAGDRTRPTAQGGIRKSVEISRLY